MLLPVNPGSHLRRLLLCLALTAAIGLSVALAACHLWAWHHFHAGQAALGRHHYAEARAHEKACRKIWPHDRDVLLLAACAARGLHDWDEAEKCLEECQRQDGSAVPREDVALEWALLRAAGGQVDSVQLFCRELLRQGHPASPRILEALAAGYMRNYRLPQAKDCLTQWLALQPEDAHALYLLGCVQYYLHEGGATANLRRAVELDAEHDEARLNLARLLIKEHPHQALAHLEYLFERQVDDPHLLLFMAECRNRLGQQAEAIQMLDRLLKRYPEHVEGLVQRGVLTLRTKQLSAAECYFRRALLRAPGHYTALYNLRICLEQQGKASEAEEFHKRLQQAQNDVQRLEAIVNGQMPQDPHNPALCEELGEIFLRRGDNEQGLHWLYRALEEDPQYEAAHRALTDYYQRKGDSERAAHHRLALQAISNEASGGR